jgi:hypothetical protein
MSIFPIPAVIAMPSEPPISTRSVGESSFEPAVFAETKPVITNPARVNPTMLHALVPRVGAKAPANGIKPPRENDTAEASAA